MSEVKLEVCGKTRFVHKLVLVSNFIYPRYKVEVGTECYPACVAINLSYVDHLSCLNVFFFSVVLSFLLVLDVG